MTHTTHPLQEVTRLRLLASALELQHLTGTAANVVPIPGGERVVVIGTPAEVAKSLADTAAARDVLAERCRQVEKEGWAPAMDDQYVRHELSLGAACYLLAGDAPHEEAPANWPWEPFWWKPSDDRRNLVKAGALILAEIERIDRAAGADQVDSEGGHHD